MTRLVYAVRAALWQLPREATPDEIRAAVEQALGAEPATLLHARPVPDDLPPGHPLPWDELVPYEKQQGGYWLHNTAGPKVFVPVRKPTIEKGQP